MTVMVATLPSAALNVDDANETAPGCVVGPDYVPRL
jgi:hypothetical protein